MYTFIIVETQRLRRRGKCLTGCTNWVGQAATRRRPMRFRAFDCSVLFSLFLFSLFLLRRNSTGTANTDGQNSTGRVLAPCRGNRGTRDTISYWNRGECITWSTVCAASFRCHHTSSSSHAAMFRSSEWRDTAWNADW